MVKYRAINYFNPRIEAFEVVKQTKVAITYKEGKHERRENLDSHDYRWFDDFDSAKKFLVEYFQKRANSANQKLVDAQSIEAPHA